MKIKSTELILWLNELDIKKGEKVVARLSRNAKGLLDALLLQGFFEDFLISKEYQDGRIELVKVR